MKKEGDLKKALALGRGLFIDLWGLFGIETQLCESPSDIRPMLPQILSRKDLACVMVEDRWFYLIAPELRFRLENMEVPLWVPLPGAGIGEPY